MKSGIIISLLIFVQGLTVHAQKIYLSNGNAADPILNHTIELNNYCGYNAVVFSAAALTTNPVLVVSQKTDSLFRPVKWMKFNKNSNGTDYTTDIVWEQDGDYKLSVVGDQKEIVSDYYTINVNEEDALNTANSDEDYNQYNDPQNTFYYIDSKVEFYNEMNKNSEPVFNADNEFAIGSVTVLVTNNKPIVANELKVSIYSEQGKKGEELIEEKNIPMTSGVASVSFDYNFGNKGTYLVSVYTTNDVWINDGTIKIK